MKEKEAQQYLDSLSKRYEIPVIKLEVVKDTGFSSIAFFDADPFKITIQKNHVNKKIITHEFFHYMLTLIKLAEGLEEHICNKVEGVK